MLDQLFVAPPTLQAGKLASARVGGIWSDDAIWLDGVSRMPRMVREWTEHQSARTYPSESTAKYNDGKAIHYNLLHRWDTLHWRIILVVTGTGDATLKLKYKGVTVLDSGAQSSGTHTLESSTSLSGAGVSISTWQLAHIVPKLTTTGNSTARIQMEYIEERPAASDYSAYATPDSYTDLSTPNAASLNKIASAITGLNAIARWPVQGLAMYDTDWTRNDVMSSRKKWKAFHHGDTLYYRVRVRKDGSSLSRKCGWRIMYDGNEVASDEYSGQFNADGDGQVYSDSVDISGLGLSEQDFVEVDFQVRVYGSGDSAGRFYVDYVFSRYAGGVDLPGAISPTANVYGDTGGQTATLAKIASVLTTMADDSGGGYNQGGDAILFGRSVAVPPLARKRIYMVHAGWPTLRYRAKNAKLHWGDDQSQGLEDWPSGSSSRVRWLDLRGLRGLAPGMVYYVESETDDLHFVAETRS